MAKKVKAQEIDKEDLNEFIQNQGQINRLISTLGQVSYEIEELTNQRQQILNQVQEVRGKSQTHFQKFEEENGPGTIDLEKGTFTPAD